MTKEVRISLRAYAKQLQVDESAIRSAIDAGKIKDGVEYYFKTVNGKKKKTPRIIPSIATKEWGFQHLTPKKQRGVSAMRAAEKLDKKSSLKKTDISDEKLKDQSESVEKEYTYSELIDKIKITPDLKYSEAILRKEILATAREKMDLEEKQGILVRKAEVDKSLFAIGDELKKKLQSIPARCIPDIRSASNDTEATNILIFEINQALHSIVQLQTA